MSRVLLPPSAATEVAVLKRRVSDLERRLRDITHDLDRRGQVWESLIATGSRSGGPGALLNTAVVEHQTRGLESLVPNLDTDAPGFLVMEPGIYIVTLDVEVSGLMASPPDPLGFASLTATLVAAGASGGQQDRGTATVPLTDAGEGAWAPAAPLEVSIATALAMPFNGTIRPGHDVVGSPGAITPDGYIVAHRLTATWVAPSEIGASCFLLMSVQRRLGAARAARAAARANAALVAIHE